MPTARCFGSSALLLTLLVVGSAMAVRAQTPKPPPLPPARQVPGINAEDQFPGGCVDCHVVQPQFNVDGRLSTQMAALATTVETGLLARAQAAAPAGVTLKGRHPAIPAAMLKNIPNGCMPCHAKTSKTAPPFASLLHSIHLGGGQQNPFMTVFQGECTHCHKLDAKTGGWSIPNGPEK